MLFLIYFGFFLIDMLIIFFAPQFLQFDHQFTYNTIIPNFFNAWANFDGVHYLNIAQYGYRQPGEYAFFPFYPLLIKALTLVTKNYLLSGLLISQIALLAALFFLKKYLKELKFNNITNWIIVFLLAFPTSFYFHAVYSESLFLFLIIAYFYFLKKKNYLAIAIFGLFAGATKIVGGFLVIPALLHFVFLIYRKTKFSYWKISTAFTPLLGLLGYCFYLKAATGDSLKFLHVMSTFGEQRKAFFVLFPQVIYRYLKIILFSSHNFQYYIALLELVSFCSFLIVLVYIFWKQYRQKPYYLLTLGSFSLINLILPSMSGSFSSLPRYALMSLIVFPAVAEIKNKWIKSLITVIFFCLHIVLLIYFSRGYFVS